MTEYLRKPGPRFILEAVAIIVAAVLTGALHLPWWQIGAVVLVVLVGAVLVESWLSRPAPAERPARPAPVVAPPEEPEELVPHVRVLREYLPQRPAEPEPEPEPEPVSETVPVPDTPVTPPGPWNIWELERALRDSGDTDQERAFLLHYLRDYAGPDGSLPPEFDDLVQESFGHLAGAAR